MNQTNANAFKKLRERGRMQFLIRLLVYSSIISIYCTGVFAEEKAPVDLVDHITAMIKVSDAKNLADVHNKNLGYLVKIEGEAFLRKGTDYYLYKSQARIGDSAVPILLLTSSEFDLEMEKLSIYREKNYEYLKRLSREGGGQFHGGPPQIPIYVLAKPKGRKDYIRPADGSTGNTMVFDVMQVCSGSSYKECRKIKKDSGWMEKVFEKLSSVLN